MASDPKWADYYAKNSEKLKAQRRFRYSVDEDYRESVLKKNAEYRERRKAEDAERRAKKRALRRERTWKTLEVEVDGVVMPMLTIGALAHAIGKGVSTCRVWEREGILPETPHRSPKGDRLYTADAVAEIKKQLIRRGKLSRSQQPLSRRGKAPFIDRRVRYADGEVAKIRLYKIGALAAAVERTVSSLEQLEKLGRLPPTPLRLSTIGYRLYTGRMIEAVKDAYARGSGSIRGEAEWSEFYEAVYADWQSLGVFGARVMERDDESKAGKRERVGRVGIEAADLA